MFAIFTFFENFALFTSEILGSILRGAFRKATSYYRLNDDKRRSPYDAPRCFTSNLTVSDCSLRYDYAVKRGNPLIIIVNVRATLLSLVDPNGLEPLTPRMQIWCSPKLS